FQSEFDKHGKCGVAGFEWLLDDVHPNLTGHRVISGLLLRALVDNGIPVPSSEFELDKKRPDAAIRASFGTAEADAFAENRAVGYARLFVALLRPDAKSAEGLAAAHDA